MNPKAEKFQEMLNKNELKFFQQEEVKDDEFNTSLFRSSMEIEGQKLPLVVIVDDSIFVVCRTLIVAKAVKDDNVAEVLDFLNKLNGSYKVLKYYLTKDKELILDCCLPTTVEGFEPDMVRALIDLSVKNLEQNYRPIMQKVWGSISLDSKNEPTEAVAESQ